VGGTAREERERNVFLVAYSVVKWEEASQGGPVLVSAAKEGTEGGD